MLVATNFGVNFFCARFNLLSNGQVLPSAISSQNIVSSSVLAKLSLACVDPQVISTLMVSGACGFGKPVTDEEKEKIGEKYNAY